MAPSRIASDALLPFLLSWAVGVREATAHSAGAAAVRPAERRRPATAFAWL